MKRLVNKYLNTLLFNQTNQSRKSPIFFADLCIDIVSVYSYGAWIVRSASGDLDERVLLAMDHHKRERWTESDLEEGWNTGAVIYSG